MGMFGIVRSRFEQISGEKKTLRREISREKNERESVSLDVFVWKHDGKERKKKRKGESERALQEEAIEAQAHSKP